MNTKGHILPRDFKKKMLRAVRAEGIYIYDDKGKAYIDGSSGALISSVGHCIPEIIEAVHECAGSTQFVPKAKIS